ncbi:MAG TPA: phosphotransferase, partial [Thermomicrobiales bacterium]|nr:phosphotransferase [Thermomicrobiales bacterium]
QPHLRPWSSVLRVPASDGLVYCKACMAGLEDETRLTAALAEWRPDLMPEVLAIDGRRGWMLTQDAGPMLRTITRAEPPNLAPWLGILPRYAELQIELAPRAGELLALGAPDHRPGLLADLLTLMLDDDEALRIGPPEGLTDDEVEHLRALVPGVAALSAELAGYGIADSLDHGDFHDGNVFIGGGRLTLADWGDCRVTHPFFTLGITLRAAAHFAGIADDAPPILAMRDAYLEPWQAVAPRADLVRAFALAYQLSHISSARNWHRLIVRLTGEQRAQEADTVPYKLRQFLLAAGQL